MDKLEDALREGLARNADETTRWRKYKEEQETAMTNLQQFRDKLSVDIMVPIGTKAFMPGLLYHTNEILVSHFQGYFSKCTSHQAQEIARHRIKTAATRLEQLEQERDMYQNKLEKPHTEGALADDNVREIIEKYDEVVEKEWRKEHKRKVREEKLRAFREISEPEQDKSHDDVMSLLDNLEMMEELEAELNKLEIEDDDMLQKLMSGEKRPPESKLRKSYCEETVIVGNGPIEDSSAVQNKPSIADEAADKINNVNGNEKSVDYTNNNNLPSTLDYESDDNTESVSSEDIPSRVLEIEAEAKNMSVPAKIKFFKKKLREVEKELQEMTIKSVEDIDNKIGKMEVMEYLSDYIMLLQDETEDDDESEAEKNAIEVQKSNGAIVEPTNKKKRITFSNKDEVQFIDKTLAANMVTRSKVALSDDSYQALNLQPPPSSNENASRNMPQQSPQAPQIDKKMKILEKVQKSVRFVSENQSQEDFNLVDKIIASSETEPNTLHIHFNHSENYFVYPGYEVEKDSTEQVIGSPADIYLRFNDYFPPELQKSHIRRNIPNGNSPTYSTEIKPVPKDKGISGLSDVSTETVNVEGSIQRIDANLAAKATETVKSILKNKEKVQLENININPTQPKRGKVKSKKKRPDEHDEDDVSAFNMVMGEVVERNLFSEWVDIDTNKSQESKYNEKHKPDPLPSEKFSDVHAPKKRISRFKQMRANS